MSNKPDQQEGGQLSPAQKERVYNSPHSLHFYARLHLGKEYWGESTKKPSKKAVQAIEEGNGIPSEAYSVLQKGWNEKRSVVRDSQQEWGVKAASFSLRLVNQLISQPASLGAVTSVVEGFSALGIVIHPTTDLTQQIPLVAKQFATDFYDRYCGVYADKGMQALATALISGVEEVQKAKLTGSLTKEFPEPLPGLLLTQQVRRVYIAMNPFFEKFYGSSEDASVFYACIEAQLAARAKRFSLHIEEVAKQRLSDTENGTLRTLYLLSEQHAFSEHSERRIEPIVSLGSALAQPLTESGRDEEDAETNDSFGDADEFGVPPQVSPFADVRGRDMSVLEPGIRTLLARADLGDTTDHQYSFSTAEKRRITPEVIGQYIEIRSDLLYLLSCLRSGESLNDEQVGVALHLSKVLGMKDNAGQDILSFITSLQETPVEIVPEHVEKYIGSSSWAEGLEMSHVHAKATTDTYGRARQSLEALDVSQSLLFALSQGRLTEEMIGNLVSSLQRTYESRRIQVDADLSQDTIIYIAALPTQLDQLKSLLEYGEVERAAQQVRKKRTLATTVGALRRGEFDGN